MVTWPVPATTKGEIEILSYSEDKEDYSKDILHRFFFGQKNNDEHTDTITNL